MVQNKLIFFYCIIVFIGLIHAIPRSAAVKNRKLAPSLTKRQTCKLSCGSECCDTDYEFCNKDKICEQIR
ncbi:unnamed protein product [Cunninghamella echinulata]